MASRAASGKNGTSVARAKLVFEGDGARLEDVKVIFRQEPAAKSGHHFGSRLVWAKDGTLFITTGERNQLRDRSAEPGQRHRQDHPHQCRRLDPRPTIRSCQAGRRRSGRSAIATCRARRCGPRPAQLWTVEHGAQGGDELNHPEAGKNYGWPIITYGIDYSGAKIGEGSAKEGMEPAVYYWVPSIATSGLAFYTGDLFPDWKGNAFVGGLAGTRVERLVFDGDEVVAHEELLMDEGKRIRDVRSGPDGALWLLDR